MSSFRARHTAPSFPPAVSSALSWGANAIKRLNAKIDYLEIRCLAAHGKIESQQKCIDMLACVLEQQLAKERIMLAFIIRILQ